MSQLTATLCQISHISTKLIWCSGDVWQGAITKRMTAIEEMAGMDVLCSDKTGTLTLNKLTVDKNLVEVLDVTWADYCCLIQSVC